MRKTIGLLIVFLFSLSVYSQNETRLLRFPAIHKDQVVFSYAGDLYTVQKQGGIARKLTNDPKGYEMFARFSPDGRNIAFTGQYDGNTEVYVMPSTGGVPERITYTATLDRDDISDRMGPNNIVMTWKDNDQIVYRSRKKSFNAFKGHLFIVSKEGGLSEQLPLPAGGFCSYSPDKTKLAFNRVFREFRTWKYYKGGMADDIWIYDFETRVTENITDNENQDIFPMWHGESIYYLSDRDRVMNLFVYNTSTKETRKLTDFSDYDIKFPSLGQEEIIFEKGGFLYYFDIDTEEVIRITVIIADDFVNGRNEMRDASKNINSYAISPDGKRVVLGARGEVFSVPVENGITWNLSQSPGVHDRNVEWSPNGQYISFISDMTGEDEIYMLNQNGEELPVQLTFNSDTYKYNPIWSPDSKKLLWSDKKLRLQYLDVETKAVTVVEEASDWEIRSYSWSPDNKWITYVLPDNNSSSKVWVYNMDTKEKQPVTDEWYNCGSPVFSEDGKYLFFTSNRDFSPIYSWTEWNHAYGDMSKVYFVTLEKATKSPFEPENDEVRIKVDDKSKEENGKGKKDDEKEDEEEGVKVNIDFDGITQRVIALPIDAGQYWNLSAPEGYVYYMRSSSKDVKPSIRMFDLDKKEEKKLGEYNGYLISFDTKKMMVINSRKYAVIDLPKSSIKIEDYIDLSGMKYITDFKAEWNQIFRESWRQMRDFFYAPNMHGADWNAIYDKYSVLVPFVNNRNDLNYIIGEMIGEVNVGHAYISGGDKPEPDRIKTGLFGAEISRDGSGYYKIDKILNGENWTKTKRSPLMEVGIDVQEGDFIIEINGEQTNEMENIYEAMVGKAGKPVEITVNDKAEKDGSRKIIIKPIDDESDLYYYNWVQENIRKVNEATDGQVGYIHIPDMGPGGLNEFVKYFYPQLSKKALIIDDRGNGGGNVSPMIIERLQRELVLLRMARNTSTYTMPRQMMEGPKVLLIDNYSASDGDLFPYQFKALKLGKVVGVRSWGGVVGIRGSLPFIDGGSLRKPEFATFDPEGHWAIEGFGVEPDIWIDNDPAKEFAGEDQQLNKAIEVALKEMENFDYKKGQPIPPFPDKSK